MVFSIIIVNWNVRDLLEKCLISIEKYGNLRHIEVIVVDNASKDGSVKMVQAKFPWVKIISNSDNLGFARGVNQGIKASNGEYIVLLNPDVEIRKSTLDNLLDGFKKNAKAGIIGGKILNTDGTIQPSVRKFPDILTQIYIILKIKHLFKISAYDKYMMTDFDYNSVNSVNQVMGAFFAIKKSITNEIGLMDEKFFLWFEEVDFCYRVKKGGWQIVYWPSSEITHLGGKSFGQVSSKARQMMYNASLRHYMLKHKGKIVWLIFALLSLISIFLAFLIGLFSQQVSEYKNK